MQYVVDLDLHHPPQVSKTARNKRVRTKKAEDESLSESRLSTLSRPPMSNDATNKDVVPATKPLEGYHGRSIGVKAVFVNPPTISSLTGQPSPTISISKNISSRSAITGPQINACAKIEDQKFPFLRLPPELRNVTYRILLTTPNAPVEMPRITRDIATRAGEWVKCRDSRSKRAKFKSLFLEILETCKQVHGEGSSIFYGCNVFKFRSCHNEGPKTVVLPARYLRLLKKIKVSVISRESYNGQEKWVADLLKTFANDEMLLETFELSWYGWKRYDLKKDGLVCRVLQLLQAEKHFTVKVLGEATMQKEMMLQLQQSIHSWKVEIHRPVNAITGAELSD